MLKHLNVGTNAQGELFPVLHLNITLFISVTQKEEENVYLYRVCEYFFDSDEDHIHVDGDISSHNKKNIVHYKMSYLKWKVRNNIEKLTLCSYYNQHLMLIS